jgi:hypothetical protein
MRRPLSKRKCRHCMTFFDPNPRSAGRQRYCSLPECRQASKAASQLKWRHKPVNRDYFKGPTHVERVRQWRQAHPAYWRRKPSETSDALQDSLTPKPISNQPLERDLRRDALQDSLFTQPAVFVGFIAQLTGLALQDDIAAAARHWQQLGHDILSGATPYQGDQSHDQTAPFTGSAAAPASSIQLGGSALGP